MFTGDEISVDQTTFRSFKHTMYTVRQNKYALSAIDTKRFILHVSMTTRAFGHHLNQQELQFDGLVYYKQDYGYLH